MCLECGDTGLLCSAPEGETVYCEGCVKGLTMALRWAELRWLADSGWLDRRRAMGKDTSFAEMVVDNERSEYERLEGLLREKQREGELVEAAL
jgi:hypothetical protein